MAAVRVKVFGLRDQTKASTATKGSLQTSELLVKTWADERIQAQLDSTHKTIQYHTEVFMHELLNYRTKRS